MMSLIKECFLLGFGLLMDMSVVAGGASKPWPTQRLEANLGEGCHFAVTLLGKKGVRVPSDSAMTAAGGDPKYAQGGMVAAPYPAPWKSKSQMTSIGFNLYCINKDSDDAKGIPFPIAYDPGRKQWIKDTAAWEAKAAELTDEYDREHQRELIRTTLVEHVNAINSQGWAMSQQDLIGEEGGRKRDLSFCLIHQSKALCGIGTVAYLVEGPKGDLTPYALEMIRSIEFLDDIPPVPAQ